MRVEVHTRGVAEASLHLEELGTRASDLRPVSRAVLPIFVRSEQRRFDSGGPGWPQLSEATQARKQSEGLDPRILRGRGVLYRSLTSRGAVRQHPGREQLSFGTDVPYARFHQASTKNMPRRDLISLTAAERRQVDRAVLEHVTRRGP